ncbi:MAG: hypothetical protein ABUL71_01380, partial [Gemmatimonadota bacterium]
FDDRGVVYIRQGAPDDHASLEQPGVPYNESWLYHRKDGPDLVMHFVAREGVTDFRLVASALDVLGYANTVRLEGSGNIQGTDQAQLPPITARGGPISADSLARLRQRLSDAGLSRSAEAILRSRQRLSPIYQRMLTSGRGSASGLIAEESAIGSRSIRIATTTDSWERRYPVDLTAQVQVLAASLDSMSPVIQVAYAIPSASLPAAVRGPGPGFAPRVRVSVLDADGSVTGVADTLGAFVEAKALGPKDYIYGVVAVAVPAGRQTVRVGLEAGRAGVVSERDTINVPAPLGTALALSDIAIGSRSVPLWWQTSAGDTVWVDPIASFHPDEPIQVYYEKSGMVRDSSYKVEIVIKRAGGTSFFKKLLHVFGGGGAEVSATTNERATASQESVHREFSLEKLKPASYVLEVTISGRSGPKVTRHQEFTVVR